MTQVSELLKDKSKKRKSADDHLHHHHHNDKKHLHNKKDKDRVETKPPTVGASHQSKTIEQLRAERLKRESEERIKANRLMLGIEEVSGNKPNKVEVDDRKRRYNNQFNPEISKI